MPVPYVKKLAKKHKMSTEKAEKKWAQAKAAAKKQGHDKDYAYVTGIFKKMMKEESNTFTFKQFLAENTYKKSTEPSPATVHVSQPYNEWTKHVYDEQIVHIADAYRGKRILLKGGESSFEFADVEDANQFAQVLKNYFAKHVNKGNEALASVTVVNGHAVDGIENEERGTSITSARRDLFTPAEAVEVKAYLKGEATEYLSRGADYKLYANTFEQMPYGVQKARTATPDEWYADHFGDWSPEEIDEWVDARTQ